jgi:hypothetical protein
LIYNIPPLLDVDYACAEQGRSLGGSFVNSFDGIGKSMAIGGAIRVASTIGVSYANGINPWTGKKLQITAKDIVIQSTLDSRPLKMEFYSRIKILEISDYTHPLFPKKSERKSREKTYKKHVISADIHRKSAKNGYFSIFLGSVST